MRHKPKYLIEESHQMKGRRQEKKAALSINSGSIWIDKGDLEVKDGNEKYHVDVKTVLKQKSYKLSLTEIDNIWNDAGTKTPVFLVYIGDYVIKCIVQKERNNLNHNINTIQNVTDESRDENTHNT